MIRLISPSKRHNEADAWLDYESMDAPRDLPDDIDLESLGPLEYIGNGAHCCAYACTYEGRPAVVKIPADQSNNDINLGYLYKELWVLQRIDHPNVIKLLGSGTSPCLFLVLERLHCTLDVKLGTNAPYESTLVGAYKRRKVRQKFTDEDACVYASKLALVLGYLHNEAMENHAIMHRDLKPSNVGIDAEGNLKLFDFGLATLAPRSELYKDTYLMTGKTGSARYMAPEVRAAQHYDTSADVFSWSLIASEMLLLRRPFDEYDYKTFMRRPSVRAGRETPAWLGFSPCSSANAGSAFACIVGRTSEVTSSYLSPQAADERPQLPKDCLPELAEAITEAWDKVITLLLTAD
ncbi:unnamed protein product [Chrysoparadoxa australica]